MPEKWNRKTRRQMSRYGIGQQMIRDQLDKEHAEARRYAARNAWGGMMLALCQEFGFDKEMLHRLAVKTLTNINKSMCATDMIDEVKRVTGFDIDMPVDLDETELDLGAGLDDLEDIDDEKESVQGKTQDV